MPVSQTPGLDFLTERYAVKLRNAVNLDWDAFTALVLALSADDKVALLQSVNAKDGPWMMSILWEDIEAGIQAQVSDARTQVETAGTISLETLENLLG